MQYNTQTIPSLKLSVFPEKIASFTTLLQTGIRLACPTGLPLGVFLDNLPGFDVTYVSERIQTIFLDGNALDDLNRPLTKNHHVLALSAAMPGLAGAIFRRNSMCSALRSRPSDTDLSPGDEKETMVHLKLFNMIAREKGPGILAMGGYFAGKTLHEFFSRRTSLLQAVTSIELARQQLEVPLFLSRLLSGDDYHLEIQPVAI